MRGNRTARKKTKTNLTQTHFGLRWIAPRDSGPWSQEVGGWRRYRSTWKMLKVPNWKKKKKEKKRHQDWRTKPMSKGKKIKVYRCCRNAFGPPTFESLLKLTWEMIAPSWPLAAEIPLAVERYLVGNISPGMTKVVTLGPKFWKKPARQ